MEIRENSTPAWLAAFTYTPHTCVDVRLQIGMENRENSMVSIAGSLHIHPMYRHKILSKTLTILFQVCSGKYVWLRSKYPAGFHIVLSPGW